MISKTSDLLRGRCCCCCCLASPSDKKVLLCYCCAGLVLVLGLGTDY